MKQTGSLSEFSCLSDFTQVISLTCVLSAHTCPEYIMGFQTCTVVYIEVRVWITWCCGVNFV